MRIGRPPVKLPPAFQAVDRKFRGVGRYPNRHVSNVSPSIVDTKRNCHAFCIACEVGVSFKRFSAPALSLTSVITYELFLFCIDADDRTFFAKIFLLQGSNVLKLFVTVRVLRSRLLLRSSRATV
jgi:hypothetical protein